MGWTPFEPRSLATVSLTVGGVSARVQFNDTSVTPPMPAVRVYNAGNAEIFIEFGGSDVIAVASQSMPLPAGAVEILRPGGSSWVAAVGGASTLRVTPGYGS